MAKPAAYSGFPPTLLTAGGSEAMRGAIMPHQHNNNATTLHRHYNTNIQYITPAPHLSITFRDHEREREPTGGWMMVMGMMVGVMNGSAGSTIRGGVIIPANLIGLPDSLTFGTASLVLLHSTSTLTSPCHTTTTTTTLFSATLLCHHIVSHHYSTAINSTLYYTVTPYVSLIFTISDHTLCMPTHTHNTHTTCPLVLASTPAGLQTHHSHHFVRRFQSHSQVLFLRF